MGTGGVVAQKLGELQIALREAKIEGWLLYDHRAQNGMAVHALGLEHVAPLRRWFYWVPADGMPALVAHAIEIEAFGELPGDVLRYDGWASLRGRLEKILPRRGSVAMEHQHIGGNPDLSRVDAGTIELVRSYGPRVVSSAELTNRFLGPWGEAGEASHARALARMIEAEGDVEKFLSEKRTPLESEVRECAIQALTTRGLVLGRPPMIATGGHTRDRHHRAENDRDRRVLPRDLVMLDLVARDPETASPFVHRSMVAAIDEVASQHVRAFAVATDAREVAIGMVRDRAASGARLLGFEVDEAARAVIGRSGLGATLIHRTGHHLGRVPFSGEACTFDSFEVHDTREAISGLAWSVHPGVYLEEFGVRATASILRIGETVRLIDPGQSEIRVIARA